MLKWLSSKVQGVDLNNLPDLSTTGAKVQLLLQVMKLDWDSVQGMLIDAVGAENVALIMAVYEHVEGLIGGGTDGVLALLNNAKELAYNADALIADALAAGAEALIAPLTTAAVKFVVEKLATGPGLGAVVSLYRGLTWLLDPQTADQLKDVVGTAIAGVKKVARNESGASLAATIEETLLKGIPLALNFAVKQVPGLESCPRPWSIACRA